MEWVITQRHKKAQTETHGQTHTQCCGKIIPFTGQFSNCMYVCMCVCVSASPDSVCVSFCWFVDLLLFYPIKAIVSCFSFFFLLSLSSSLCMCVHTTLYIRTLTLQLTVIIRIFLLSLSLSLSLVAQSAKERDREKDVFCTRCASASFVLPLLLFLSLLAYKAMMKVFSLLLITISNWLL